MIAFLVSLMIAGSVGVQKDTLDLHYLYSRAYENYPLAEKFEIQQKITKINKRIAQSGYYPDLNFSGRASYQSEVTEVNFVSPGADPPTFSKDQYKVSLDINQPLYRGGIPGKEKHLEEVRGNQQRYSVEVSLHKIREQIDRLYFTILLLQQQNRSLSLLMEQIRTQLETVRSRVKNGILLPSQQRILEVELLKAEQDSVQTRHDIVASYEVLSELVGMDVQPETFLSIPDPYVKRSLEIQPNRPEFSLFQSSRELLEQQKELSEARRVPKISAFGTTSYGRPGLNVFNDDLHAYFIVGVQLRWNFWDWVNGGRESDVLQQQMRMVDADEEAFSRQMNASLQQSLQSITALEELIERDEEIIELRESVVRETSSQLNNGTVTASDYISELTKTNQARLTKFMHQVRLSKQKIDYLTTLGISWKGD